MMDTDVAYAMSVCVLPFIPGDIIKIVAATLLGKAVTGALNKADLLPQA
jgi:biotin transporter BioY